jgi:HTH-type transcriptional regulator / antitoxin HigA
LTGAGVRLVVVEYLLGAKLDGACFWINDGRSPVIALSLRLDRIDNFWHTLFHEVDHILHNEGKDAPIVDLLDAQVSARTDLPDFERRANRNAADYCINAKAMEAWIARASKVSSRARIVAFAEQMSVHPGLVVGQLQHRHLIPYSYHREFLEKVRSLVVTSVPTDGYRRA